MRLFLRTHPLAYLCTKIPIDWTSVPPPVLGFNKMRKSVGKFAAHEALCFGKYQTVWVGFEMIALLSQAQFRFVKISALRPQQGIPSRLLDVLASQIPAIKNGGALTSRAIVLFFSTNPPWVIQEGRTYRLALTSGLGAFLESLPPDTRIPVLVLPKQKKADMEVLYRLQLQTAFLQKVVHGLDLSIAADSIVTLWGSMGKQERIELSPEFATKSGLSKSAGLNRRTKPRSHTIVTSAFRQEELLEGIIDVG